MKTERQQDQEVIERMRRENLERVDAGGCAPPVIVTNPKSAAVEAVAIDRYDLGPDGMYWDRAGDYVRYEDHQSALDALRGEVERLRTELSAKGDYVNEALIARADAAERRVAELEGVLSSVIADASWRTSDNTLWPRLVKVMQTTGARAK